jgi:hypothetical protein
VQREQDNGHDETGVRREVDKMIVVKPDLDGECPIMPGSDLTDRTRTGPFHGSHLTDTVRRTAVGPVRRLSADCPRTADGQPADRRTGPTVLNMFKNFSLSVSGPCPVRQM